MQRFPLHSFCTARSLQFDGVMREAGETPQQRRHQTIRESPASERRVASRGAPDILIHSVASQRRLSADSCRARWRHGLQGIHCVVIGLLGTGWEGPKVLFNGMQQEMEKAQRRERSLTDSLGHHLLCMKAGVMVFRDLRYPQTSGLKVPRGV